MATITTLLPVSATFVARKQSTASYKYSTTAHSSSPASSTVGKVTLIGAMPSPQQQEDKVSATSLPWHIVLGTTSNASYGEVRTAYSRRLWLTDSSDTNVRSSINAAWGEYQQQRAAARTCIRQEHAVPSSTTSNPSPSAPRSCSSVSSERMAAPCAHHQKYTASKLPAPKLSVTVNINAEETLGRIKVSRRSAIQSKAIMVTTRVRIGEEGSEEQAVEQTIKKKVVEVIAGA